MLGREGARSVLPFATTTGKTEVRAASSLPTEPADMTHEIAEGRATLKVARGIGGPLYEASAARLCA